MTPDLCGCNAPEPMEDFAGLGGYEDSFVLAVFVVGHSDVAAGLTYLAPER